MILSAEQQTALEGPAIKTVYFAQFDFLSASVYVCSANIGISWGGHDWIGLGGVGGISSITSTEGTESQAVNFVLNIAQQQYLAMAVGEVSQYRGLPATLYFCPLDEELQLISTPQIAWKGFMDSLAISIEGEEGTINLKCETSVHGLRKPSWLRLNAARQKYKDPRDTGFDYLVDLIARPHIWMSKKFQASLG